MLLHQIEYFQYKQLHKKTATAPKDIYNARIINNHSFFIIFLDIFILLIIIFLEYILSLFFPSFLFSWFFFPCFSLRPTGGMLHPLPPPPFFPSCGGERRAGVARPSGAVAERRSARLSSPPGRGQGWVGFALANAVETVEKALYSCAVKSSHTARNSNSGHVNCAGK